MGFAFIIFTIIFSIGSAIKIWKQRKLLSEFGASRALAFAVILYPIGMICLTFLQVRLGLFGATLAGLAAFVPGLVLSKQAQNKLQRAGNDRAQRAEDVAAKIFMLGIGCICYFIIIFGIALAAEYSSNPLR